LVRDLPLHRCEDLTLLTADSAIAAYDVRTIDAAR
jgi:hypothetical protein